jgi:hypothetical protein
MRLVNVALGLQSKWPSRKEYMRYKRAHEREQKQKLETDVAQLQHNEGALRAAVMEVKTDLERLQRLE